MTWVKVCGLSKASEARAAADAGADAIGLVMVPGSVRAIRPDVAASVAEATSLPSFLLTMDTTPSEMLDLADFIGSTAKLIRHVEESPKDTFIVATEMGILHQMQKRRPDATLIGAQPGSGCQCAVCPYMRLNTMEKLYLCLRDRRPEVTVPPDIAKRALAPVERMLALG